MNWRSTLQAKTRDSRFLWHMVTVIIGLGIVAGYVVEHWREPSPLGPAALAEGLRQGQEAQWEIDQLAAAGRWSEVWWAIPRSQLWRLTQRGPLALAMLTGAAWLAFALHALHVSGLRDMRLWLALAAVPLGVLSIWPTHFFDVWQEFTWGLEQSASLLHGLRFYILGVGLREETAKLLCLLPLMPLLVRMRSELAALLVSGCVGIGFALAENANYFVGAGGYSTLGRYLTANPFHMTLTGLVGLAVYRACRNPQGWGPQALATFGLMVFAHGAYDSFAAIPALADYSILAIIIFAAVVYQFFRELRDARARRPDTISLTANFLCGVSLVTAATFVYLSGTFGCSAAFEFLLDGVVGLAVMVYLFLREMPETLVTV